MIDDDPFGFGDDGQKTRLVPKPGGLGPSGAPGVRVAAAGPTPGAGVGLYAPFSQSAGVNALLDCATPLLVLLTRLYNTVSHSDPDGLRNQVANEVNSFGDRASTRGIPNDDVFVARYVLCTALDEAVLNTPWGSDSSWRQQNLLVSFHGEADGGDKFFTLLDRLNSDPTRKLPLLELMYTCLSLGFQGRYRVHRDGQNRLAEIREQLYQTIRMLRDKPSRELSPHWQGVVDRKNPLVRHVPLWVVGALGAGLLLALYWVFSSNLNDYSDRVSTQLSAVNGKEVITRKPTPVRAALRPPEPTILPTLQQLLRDEIGQERIAVLETESHVVIRLRGDGLFASGSAVVKQAFLDTLERIADALKTIPGAVLVTGHTDSVPIRTVRFPSNWHLSQARAEAVMALLASRLGSADRLAAKGRAHNEPLADNTTAANRARNRRVEIVLPKS